MYTLGSFLAYKLPLRFVYWVGTTIGDTFYLLMKRHAANSVSNMRRVLGNDASWQQVKHAARQSFRNYGRLAVDFIRYPHMNDTDVFHAAGVPEGLENLDKALERGKGIVVITAHFGNWDIGGRALARLGYKMNAVAERFEPEKMDALMNGTRRRANINVITIDTPSALKEMFLALRRNELVFLLFDRPEPDTGVAVQFFGETVYVPGGPVALAIKTGAAIAIGYSYRKPDGITFRSVAEHEVDYKDMLTGNKERDIQVVTQEVVRRMEVVIRQHPEQWFMFREMWPRTARHNAEVRKRRFWGGKRDMRVASG
jgi:KDO2-lipid IV(A) lauroyltransferase